MKTDLELKKDVEDELSWEPTVNAAHIGVAAKNGVVTLSGHIPSYAERWEAESAAKRVFGVSAVANELEVKLPGSSERSDEDIAAACWKRCAGSLASARRNHASSSGSHSSSGGKRSHKTAAQSSASESAWKGSLPVRHSNATTPSDHRSERQSTCLPRSCSGLA